MRHGDVFVLVVSVCVGCECSCITSHHAISVVVRQNCVLAITF